MCFRVFFFFIVSDRLCISSKRKSTESLDEGYTSTDDTYDYRRFPREIGQSVEGTVADEPEYKIPEDFIALPRPCVSNRVCLTRSYPLHYTNSVTSNRDVVSIEMKQIDRSHENEINAQDNASHESEAISLPQSSKTVRSKTIPVKTSAEDDTLEKSFVIITQPISRTRPNMSQSRQMNTL